MLLLLFGGLFLLVLVLLFAEAFLPNLKTDKQNTRRGTAYCDSCGDTIHMCQSILPTCPGSVFYE